MGRTHGFDQTIAYGRFHSRRRAPRGLWDRPTPERSTELKQDEDAAHRLPRRRAAVSRSPIRSASRRASWSTFAARSSKNMAAELNISDLKVGYVLVTAANRFDAITTGKADLLCEPTSETLSRREQVDFSIATFIDGASLLVSRRRSERLRRSVRQEGRRAGRHNDRTEPARHPRERQYSGGRRPRQDPRGGARDARSGGRSSLISATAPSSPILPPRAARRQAAPRQQLFFRSSPTPWRWRAATGFPPRGRSGAEPDLPLRRNRYDLRA